MPKTGKERQQAYRQRETIRAMIRDEMSNVTRDEIKPIVLIILEELGLSRDAVRDAVRDALVYIKNSPTESESLSSKEAGKVRKIQETFFPDSSLLEPVRARRSGNGFYPDLDKAAEHFRKKGAFE